MRVLFCRYVFALGKSDALLMYSSLIRYRYKNFVVGVKPLKFILLTRFMCKHFLNIYIYKSIYIYIFFCAYIYIDFIFFIIFYNNYVLFLHKISIQNDTVYIHRFSIMTWFIKSHASLKLYTWVTQTTQIWLNTSHMWSLEPRKCTVFAPYHSILLADVNLHKFSLYKNWFPFCVKVIRKLMSKYA